MKLLLSNTVRLFILIFLASYSLCAQSTNFLKRVQYEENSGSKVRVIQSEDLDKLLDLHLYEESKQKGIEGYRIRLYRGSGPRALKELEETKAKFLQNQDDVALYVSFDYPDYLLAVGDFRTFSEALKYLKSIEQQFPNKLYIISTRIYYPKL